MQMYWSSRVNFIPHPDNGENARLSYAIRQILFRRKAPPPCPHRIDMQNVRCGARLMSELRVPAIYLALVELSCIAIFRLHLPFAVASAGL